MRIALVKEGFSRPESEKAVDEKVLEAAELFKKLGATVDEVSIPMHLIGPAIWTPIGVEGIAQTMMLGEAQPIPPADAPRELYFQRALEMIGNTCPFDITHHPAMTVPCGMIDGLPAALMLVGKHYDEPTIYRAAHAFEQAGDWRQR